MKKKQIQDRPNLRFAINTIEGPVNVEITAGEAALLIECLKGALSEKKTITPDVLSVLNYLNEKTNSRYRSDTGGMIAARLREGNTVEDCKKVIDIKTEHWGHDELMFKFLRPSTLFRPAHFQEYLNEKRSPYEQR